MLHYSSSVLLTVSWQCTVQDQLAALDDQPMQLKGSQTVALVARVGESGRPKWLEVSQGFIV